MKPQVRVRLREAMEAYEARTGQRITYDALARATGISRATIESIATRESYEPSLGAVAKLCSALGCGPGELLELRE